MNSIERSKMNGKPVYEVPAKSVLNMESGFSHKLLCDGPTFSTGSACAYSCSFCYVPDLMRKNPHMRGITDPHEKVVIRRNGAVEALRKQLTDARGNPKYLDFADTRVVYASPLVDVAANMSLVNETIECCLLILEFTNWQIRLLSKSNLLPKVAQGIPDNHKARMIFGVSTGTLDDGLARSFEEGTPLVTKRVESLHWLQERGYRTFGMICPSLPQDDYGRFASEMRDAVRADKCEHVWAEVINARGESFTRTYNALMAGGFTHEAGLFANVSHDKAAWEKYARATFEAHAGLYPPGKLRFLQYVTKDTREWWAARQDAGAILL
jgi:DNA repair photolyase